VSRWRDALNEVNAKEDGAATIIRRLRLRFLRKSFDLYVAGVNYKKQEVTNEERCKIYKAYRDERTKRRIYNAWHLFRNNHTTAKRYWYRIFLRIETTMK